MMKPTQKLFLLDAMALIYRAHFAFSKNPRITTKGLNTGAVFGFTNTLLEVIQKEKPTHLGIAFDTSAPTFRHTAFEAYKAQRQEQPEDISVAIPLVKRIAAGFHIPVLELDGYEADDIIGTLALEAAQQGFEVFMMTPDKDFGQLVRDHVYLYKPAFMGKGVEILGVQEVLRRWDIAQVDQVRDLLGLMGDAVDNIPGIPGVGEKTAQKLINTYGSVEQIIEKAIEIPGKLGENIRNFAAQGLQSKELATICTTVPITFDPEQLAYTGPDQALLKPLFEELEFRTLSSRVLGNQASTLSNDAVDLQTGQMDMFASGSATTLLKASSLFNNELSSEEEPSESILSYTIANTDHRYYTVTTAEEQLQLVHYLMLQEEFCFDTETDSLDILEAKLVGLSFSYVAGEAYYIPVPSDDKAARDILDIFRKPLEDGRIRKIGQNLKFDLQVLASYGIEMQGELYDTMLAHYLLEPDARHGMDQLARQYLQYEPVSITSLIGKKGAEQGNMGDVPLESISEYASEDADITLKLKKILAPKLIEAKLDLLHRTVETPLIPVLAAMEREGIKVEVASLKEISDSLETELHSAEEEVYKLAGIKFNLSSPKQLGEILFEHLRLDAKAKKTKTGQYATNEEVLSKLAGTHPIVQYILEYREFQKLKSTYVVALPQLIHPSTGRVHTSYNQAVAATGRLSSTGPNLQNIPIRTDRGREIRKAFVPRNEEYLLFSADYSQIELRIMADFSKDESMLQAFKENKDIHSITASKVYKVPLEAVTGDMRRKAKMVNFGIIYGISAFGLSQRLSIPRKEASEIIEAYFKEFPSIKHYMDSIVNKARELGYVETLLGRRRYLRDIHSRNMTMRGFAERNAINAPIQGSAADMIKLAMIRIHEFLKKERMRSKMLLQVHDELVFDMHRDEQTKLTHAVQEIMSSAMPLSVPVEVGLGVGANWLEAH